MKNYWIVLIAVWALFFLGSYFVCQTDSRPVDGPLTIGCPLSFYTLASGFGYYPSGPPAPELNTTNLLIDFLLIGIFAWIVVFLFNKESKIRLGGYFAVIKFPRETFGRELKSATLGGAAKKLLWSGAIVGFLGILMRVLIFYPRSLRPIDGSLIVLEGAWIVIMPIAFLLAGGIGGLLDRWVSRIFGGKATGIQMVQLIATYLGPIAIISTIVSAVSLYFQYMGSGMIFGIISLVVWIYFVYLAVLAVSVANGFEFWKAAIVKLILVGILMGLYFVLIIINLFFFAPSFAKMFLAGGR